MTDQDQRDDSLDGLRKRMRDVEDSYVPAWSFLALIVLLLAGECIRDNVPTYRRCAAQLARETTLVDSVAYAIDKPSCADNLKTSSPNEASKQ